VRVLTRLCTPGQLFTYGCSSTKYSGGKAVAALTIQPATTFQYKTNIRKDVPVLNIKAAKNISVQNKCQQGCPSTKQMPVHIFQDRILSE
jgi:hypothetical protein